MRLVDYEEVNVMIEDVRCVLDDLNTCVHLGVCKYRQVVNDLHEKCALPIDLTEVECLFILDIEEPHCTPDLGDNDLGQGMSLNDIDRIEMIWTIPDKKDPYENARKLFYEAVTEAVRQLSSSGREPWGLQVCRKALQYVLPTNYNHNSFNIYNLTILGYDLQVTVNDEIPDDKFLVVYNELL